jgi:PIN domain nuclease of toxin-antitoxin system
MGRSLLILLDTHVVIWLAHDHQRISTAAHSAIKEARNKEARNKERGLAICSITLIETARFASYRRVTLAPDLETFLSDLEERFIVLPITANIALQAFELPPTFPKDPVDRIFGATALVEDIPLLTADREIRKSRAVPTIW